MSAIEAHLPVLQVIVPLLSAPLVWLLRERGLAWAGACAASWCAFAIAIRLALLVLDGGPLGYALGSWAPPYGIELRVDAFSALLLLVVTGASSVSLLVAHASLEREMPAARQPLFYTAWLLALAGLAGIVVAGDVFNIFVFMEISALATYILVAGGPRRQALKASFRYLVMGTIGASFYLIGVGLLYLLTGTLNLADIAARLPQAGSAAPLAVAAGFITVGLALKAAVFPLHGWQPNAYAFAPHAASAFLAACSAKVALYVLLRVDFALFHPALPGHDALFAWFIGPLAAAAVVAGSLLAIVERDLKRLLAYSSVAQTGYILLGAGLLSEAGLGAGVLHLFAHALAKGTLFLAVTCLCMNAASSTLPALGGIAREMPLTAAALVLAALSLIGIPGTAGFIGKWQLLTAGLAQGTAGIALIAAVLLGTLLAVIYLWRVIETIYFAAPPEPRAGREAPPAMRAVLWIAALGTLWFGLSPELPLALATAAAETLLATR